MWRDLSPFLWRVELAGAAEVADMLGVTTQQVDRLARQPGFPKPVAVLKAGRVWRRRDIERWATTRRRGRGRPEKPYPPNR